MTELLCQGCSRRHLPSSSEPSRPTSSSPGWGRQAAASEQPERLSPAPLPLLREPQAALAYSSPPNCQDNGTAACQARRKLFGSRNGGRGLCVQLPAFAEAAARGTAPRQCFHATGAPARGKLLQQLCPNTSKCAIFAREHIS